MFLEAVKVIFDLYTGFLIVSVLRTTIKKISEKVIK